MQISIQKTTFNSNKTKPFSPQKNPLEICLLSNNIYDYHIVSQGKTTIPSVDDSEEMGFTEVSSKAFMEKCRIAYVPPVFIAVFFCQNLV
jgi:hypothetical protein